MPTNWIDDVLSEVEHVETPRAWIWWSLACAISASAGNNYFLKALKGAVTYKLNLYVILLGESGLGKQFPVSLSKNLVEKADITRVIYGRSSIQAIIQELSKQVTREKKGPIQDSRGFIVNGELSTAIIQDPDSLTILTDLYDVHSQWTNKLKGDGNEKLKEPYLTCLFGSSPAHFYEAIPQVNIDGGYIGRNLIVYEEKRYKNTDLLDENDSDVNQFDYEKFVPHLEDIAKAGGRIIADTSAKELFNTFRRKWREEQKEDKTGFLNRVPDHILKVAMCLTLADYNASLIMTGIHIEEAIERVIQLVYSNKRATEGKGIDPLAEVSKIVLDLLLSAPDNELKRRQLLTKGYGTFDSAVLDKVLENLIEIEWISRERYIAGSKSDWIIKLAGEPLKQYQKFKSDRENRRKKEVEKNDK